MSSNHNSNRLESVPAGDLKKSDLVQVRDRPCKLVDVKHVKTGKHGPCKCIFTSVDILSGRKFCTSEKSSSRVYRPVVDRAEGVMLGVDGDGRRVHVLGPNDEYLEHVLLPAKHSDAEALVEAFEAEGAGDGTIVLSYVTVPVGPRGDEVCQVVAFRREG